MRFPGESGNIDPHIMLGHIPIGTVYMCVITLSNCISINIFFGPYMSHYLSLPLPNLPFLQALAACPFSLPTPI